MGQGQNQNQGTKSNNKIDINLQQPKEESLGKGQGLKLNLSKLGGADSVSNDKRANAHKVEMEQRLTGLVNRKAVLRNVLQQ